MIISITAHRDLAAADLDIIHAKMKLLVNDVQITRIYFGGARGGDTEALKSALAHRASTTKRPDLFVVVPDTIASQPVEARRWIKQADLLIELHNPITKADGYASYTNRDHYLVDKCDRLVAFCRGGETTGGTLKTMLIAVRNDKPVDEVRLGERQ